MGRNMWSLQDAKNRFSAVVDAALSGRPQEVTRRGKPAVVVLAADEYRRLVSAATRHRDSFADHLLGFPGLPGADAPRMTARPRDVEL